jgi:hypothetical protein
MAMPPSPKPMPTTGMPDRVDPNLISDMDMKRGMSSDRKMEVNPGRKGEGEK